MQLETIDKRTFAFGLTWIQSHDSAADDIVSARKGDDDGFIFYTELDASVPAPAKGRKAGKQTERDVVVGFAVLAQKLRHAPCSAAAALATLKQDGLFVAQLTDSSWWYCGIKGGVVVPDTDLIGSPDLILHTVTAMSAGLELPVFAGDDLAFVNSEPFDLQDTLRRTKCRPMRKLSSGGIPMMPLIAIVVVAGVGFFGYRTAFPPKPKLTPAQQQALLRQSYIASVNGAVQNLPVTSRWVLQAYKQARNTLPPYMTGWALDGVSCTPHACMATYATTGPTFALSPLLARFGMRLKVLRDHHSATVVLPLQTPMVVLSESYLRAERPSSMSLLDWVGSVPVLMGGAKINGNLLENDLAQQFSAPAAGMPPLVMEQVSVKGDVFLDPVLLREVVGAGSRGGFAPVQFAFSFGDGKVPPSWRMTWTRLHG